MLVRANPSAHADRVAERLLQVLAQSAGQARLELTHPLARNPELVAELLQRERLVRYQALLEDLHVFSRERLLERLELLVQDDLELRTLGRELGRIARARQELEPSRGAAVTARHRRVERRIRARQAAIHLAHVG